MYNLNSQNIGELPKQMEILLDKNFDIISNLSNASAIIKGFAPTLNWAGFYIMKNGELILGPFQGKPACLKIAVGKGVCGTAVKENKPLYVPNVHEFKGHIACDSESNSEMVIPLHYPNGETFGVLDLDCPLINGFTTEMQAAFTQCASIIEKAIL